MKPCPFDGGVGILYAQRRFPRTSGESENIIVTENFLGTEEEIETGEWAFFVACQSCAGEGPWAKSPGHDGLKGGAIGQWNMRQVIS